MSKGFWIKNTLLILTWATVIIFSWFLPLVFRTAYAWQLLFAMTLGVGLLFLRKGLFGVENHLLWFEKDLGILDPGFYFIFNFTPFTEGLGFGGTIAHLVNGIRVRKEDMINIYRDQRLPSYDVHVRTDSFLRADVHRFMNNVVLRYLFDFYDNHAEIQHWRVGRTLIFFTILTTIVCNSFFPAQGGYLASRETPRISSSASQSSAQVIVNLNNGGRYLLPLFEDFRVLPDSGKQHYKMYGSQRYILYSNPPPGALRGMRVEMGSCAIIPAGITAVLESTTPPRRAINMENAVWYSKRLDAVTLTDKVTRTIRMPGADESMVRRKSTWHDITHIWNTVTPYAGIEVSALPFNSLPYGSPPGGLVCF